MNAKRRPPSLPLDPSLHPTRKVESMSSLAAELLLQEQDVSDELSAPRIRSNPPPFDNRPSRPSVAEPWRPAAPPATFYTEPPPLRASGRGLRIALFALGAVLLVAATVMVTLVVAR